MVAVLGLVGGLGVATALVLNAFSDNLVFFHSPSDVVEQHVAAGKRFRIGGLVEAGSVKKDGLVTEFDVTDLKHTVHVRYTGLLPDLFREGQGVGVGRVAGGERVWPYGEVQGVVVNLK